LSRTDPNDPDNHRIDRLDDVPPGVVAKWEKPAKDTKIIPFPIERVRFGETRTVAFRVKQAA
jgi:hypothetical protein